MLSLQKLHKVVRLLFFVLVGKGHHLFWQNFILGACLVLSSRLVHASQRPRDQYEWRRHHWLARTINCADLMVAKWPPALAERDLQLPRILVHPPIAGKTYPVEHILNGATSGAFLIGWPEGLPNSFRYRVIYRLISASRLGMSLGNVGTGQRIFLYANTTTQETWFELSSADPDMVEVVQALAAKGVPISELSSLGLWLEHSDSSPPQASEVANLEVLNRLGGLHHGLPEQANLSLNVVGSYRDQILAYSIELRPRLSK
jgi:hypothetical protein